MKNLKLRTKLCLLGISAILVVGLGMVFMAMVLKQVQDESIAYLKIPFFGISLIFILFALFLLASILRHAAEPLNSLGGTMEKISKGDFAAKADETVLTSQEEFGKLARTLDKMRKNVGELVADVCQEAEEISRAVNTAGAHMDGLNGEMEAIFTASEELSGYVKNAEEAAVKIHRCTGDIEGAARHMAARAQEGTEWAKDIRKRAMYAKDGAVEKAETVRLNKKNIRDSMTQTLKDAKLVEQISVLAESVVELTEQTNLLSLNAGIEAARTGESGKEFAATIEEIRNLTDQTKKYAENIQWATDEVTSALVNLRKDTKRLLEFIDTDIISAFHFFVRVADTYNSDAGEMNFLAADFGETSEEILAFVNSIMTSLEDIKGAFAECGGRISGIADKSVRAAARTGSVAKEFEGTKQAADLLDEKAGRFTLEDGIKP